MWSNGDTLSLDSNLAPGPYSLTVTDQNGCVAVSTNPAIIYPSPAQSIAEVLPTDITVLKDSMIQLTTTFNYPTSSIVSYSWSPAIGLSCIACPDPIVNTTNIPDSSICYTVTIKYNNGCSANAKDTLHILSTTGAAIADAFTPNDDGKNDVFFIITKGVKDSHMTLYDRWGQLIYESFDVNNGGWDGKFKGKPQPQGEYVYFLAINYINGQSLNKTGTVTLIR